MGIKEGRESTRLFDSSNNILAKYMIEQEISLLDQSYEEAIKNSGATSTGIVNEPNSTKNHYNYPSFMSYPS